MDASVRHHDDIARHGDSVLASRQGSPLSADRGGVGGRMNTKQCPVCGGKAMCSTRPVSPRPMSGHLTVEIAVGKWPLSVSCEECGDFTAEEGFFPYVGDTIPPEDRPAIAAYLQG